MANGKLSPTFYYEFEVAGKRYRGSTGCTTQREASKYERNLIGRLRQQKSAKALVENFRDVLTGGSRIELDDAWDEFMKRPRKHSTCDREIMNHKARWEDFVAFLRGEHAEVEALREVTRAMADAYIRHVRSEGRYEKGIAYTRSNTTGRKRKPKEVSYTHKIKRVSANTANRYLLTCGMVFRALAHDAGLEESPFQHIAPLDLSKKIARRSVYTAEELEKIYAAALGEWFFPLFMVGANTALSEGDICTLRWSEVSPDCTQIETDRNKTAAQLRIPCMPALQNYLASLPREGEFVFPELARRYLKEYRRELPDGTTRVSYPLRGGIGKALTQFLQGKDTAEGRKGGIGIESSKEVEGRDRKASIRDAHSLRHTFIYLAGMYGLPLPTVQSLVGHMTPKMTQLYMDHASDQAKREAMARMPSFLGGAKVLKALTNGEAAKQKARAEKRSRIIDKLKQATDAQLDAVLAVFDA